ncbi:MAG: peptidoglycan recognition family protein [Marinoscillum sp.]
MTVDTVSIISANKLRLTELYSLQNYGIESYKLDSIKMTVVHYTVIPTLKQTFDLFLKDSLASNRSYIRDFNVLNVGIHYVIDREGSIYNLLPDSVMARHVIGFNHISLGIENIARDSSELTYDQLVSNARLINFLKFRYPEMEFLIGHNEYNNKNLPHFSLFKSLNHNYKPYDKPDPGRRFMSDLRQILKDQYDLEFLE